jgi:hypothetical protein
MKHKLFYFILVIMLQSVVFGQTALDKYSYVVVPEDYTFLTEKDKFQLNSLTKYLFEKNGFNAYYQNELPDVRNCDGLRSDVEFKSGFTFTRMVIVLKDCKGEEVYRSEEGRSKFKEFRKAYQDALRKAFASIEDLKVQQSAIEVRPTPEAIDKMKGSPTEDADGWKIKKNLNTEASSLLAENYSPQSKYSNYEYRGLSYLLKKTEVGYTLLSENDDDFTTIGEIRRENEKYIFTSKSDATKATFTSDKNLVIGSGELLKIYTFKN